MARQVCTSCTTYLKIASWFVREAHKDATLRPHGYLIILLKQDTPDDWCRFRTNIYLQLMNIV